MEDELKTYADFARIVELCASYEILRAHAEKISDRSIIVDWVDTLDEHDRFIAIAYERMRSRLAQEIILEGPGRMVEGRKRNWPADWYRTGVDVAAASAHSRAIKNLSIAIEGGINNTSTKE